MLNLCDQNAAVYKDVIMSIISKKQAGQIQFLQGLLAINYDPAKQTAKMTALARTNGRYMLA